MEGVRLDTRALARQTSVIVVAYNAGHFLRDCIVSILLTRSEVEVVVVDNGSTDGAVERVKTEFPAIRVVRSERNGGFGAGANLGATAARGAYLVFLNPDATVAGGWLDALVRPLAEDASVGLVTPKVLLRSDPALINVAGLDVHLSGISMCRGLESPRTALDEAREVAAISGVAAAVRRDVFEALGGFDEDFFLYMEDVDISLRAWLGGYRCLYLPRTVALHDYALEVDARKTFYVERGRYLMLLKAFSWRTLLGLVPTLFLVEVITWGWLLWRNPRAIVQKLQAYRWILAHRAQIAEKRRRVQAHRTRSDSVFLARCQWHLSFGQLAGPRMARAAEVVFGPFLRGSSYVVQWGMRSEGTCRPRGWTETLLLTGTDGGRHVCLERLAKSQTGGEWG
jgi:GT2 family glycosyltransferase